MPNARLATSSDLSSLLALYRQSDVSTHVQATGQARQIWGSILDNDGTDVFVSNADARIVASCMLITAPNLLREGRRHGFLENVVTHPDYQGMGYGRSVVLAALRAAWAKECHHVLMQSGRKDPRVHRFYERCGFVPGLRTGYVAQRPPSE